MYYIDNELTITLEIKKSKFITYICSYDNFKSTMIRLKLEHPKGRHFVYAYRYLNEYDQVVENSSDDGEPKGTSGKPSLSVLKGANIINSAVIIVRYFGGIKLGTGGLVKAYSDAVNLILNDSILLPYLKLSTKTIIVSYSQFSQVEYMLSLLEVKIIDKIFTQNIKLILEGSDDEFIKLEAELFRDIVLEDM